MTPFGGIVAYSGSISSASATVGVAVLDIHKVAPQSWFNLYWVAYLYMNEDFPEEEYMTHTLKDEDPNHAQIARKQQVFRRGPHNYL